MPLLTEQKIGEGNLVAIPNELLTFAASGRVKYDAADVGGDTFDNDGRTFLHVKNEGGGPLTITVVAKLTKSDVTKVIPAGGDGFFGPFPLTDFNATSVIVYSGVTSLTLAALKV